ncbi:tetratricopeptide repeat protein (macronuclear) [Tetrahymena thermophila SB210]|uniref:Tetratricopeptide repeat protein n=1 Tax=Tetrahymena thermophila (strain SB210) TaxID=312017 RepID=I7MKD6_TETTS|nr:tetratricopeptide repeat protein [Tetrahymena thermophila SB210]EAR98223.2 tetratricopeptide repeat protein [Tetrahymena thermophila SB210]|eukprot:XP_001018468.2 tetratricopeptide repeat protein [Tetrahymena thermophila SB210]
MFYIGNSSIKKGTFIGALLSIMIIVSTVSYLIYLSWQYGTNQINPKFRSQSFITDEQIDVPLHQDLIAFRYEYDTNKNLDDLQAKNNKTYLQFSALFTYQNQTQSNITLLNITQCQNPSLKGFSCLDFQILQNKYLTLKTQQDILSTVIILVYGCYQVNDFKQSTANNCASQEDINSLLNGDTSGFRIKLYTSQFNITSLQPQVNYRNAMIFTSSDQQVVSTFKTQMQQTSINQGFILQKETQFSAPIQYDQQNQQFNFNQNFAYLEVILQLDEILQQIQISFPTFPEVLALVSSTFALSMTFGAFAKFVSRKMIEKNLLFFFLQNMFQDTYEQILSENKFFEKKQDMDLETKQSQTEALNEIENSEISQSIIVPSFKAKSRQSVEYNNLTFSTGKDELDENRRLNESKQFKFQLKIASPIQKTAANSKNCNYQFNSIKKLGLNLKNTKSNLINYSVDNAKIPIYSTEHQKDKSCCIPESNIKKIQQYYKQKFKAIQNKNFLKSVQRAIYMVKFPNISNICRLFKKVKNKNTENHFNKKLIEGQVNQQLDIFQLYKDVIFLKKAILLILSKEQLAAIQLVGCSSQYLEIQNNQQAIDYEKTKILNWVETYRNFNLREEEFIIDDEDQVDQTISIRICKQKQSKRKCVLKLYNSSLSMLDFVYNATLDLKRNRNFEENIYKKKAFLSHYGVGILNGHFSICIQIPNGGSIQNYLKHEQNYTNLASILIDYIDIFFLMKSQGIEYYNLKVSNMFVHDNKGILGEISVFSEEQKAQQKNPDTIDLFSCIIQILLNFTSNYIEHINLLDSDLVSLINQITSEKDATSLNYLYEDFYQKLRTLDHQKLIEIKQVVQQEERIHQIMNIFEANKQDSLYQQESDKYTQITKKNYLLIEDAVIIDSFLQDEETENALNKCLQITEDTEEIQDSNIYYFYGLSLQSDLDQQQMQIEYLLKCLLLNSHHGDCLNKLASIYEEISMFQEAVEFIEQSLELNPYDDSKYFRLGTIFQKQKLYSNSIKAYKSCIQLNNKKYIYLYYLATVYMLNNNFKNAIFYFKKYLKQYPTDSHAIYNLSKLYFFKKNMKKSLFYLYKMRKIDKYQNECQQLYENIFNQISIDKQFNIT